MAALPEGTNSVVTVLLAHAMDNDAIRHIVRCVFEAGGKAAFMEPASRKGMREWLGVPEGMNDGRVMGALIETQLQSMLMGYEIVSFDEDGAVYDIARVDLERRLEFVGTAYVSMWHGMVKTLVGADWSVWEDDSTKGDVNHLRIHVQKKIDKFK